MIFIIGLGNVGKRYQHTRHNAGFLVLDYIAEKYSIPFSPGKGDYYFGQTEIKNSEVLLVKPTTLMNRSGQVVDQLADQFNFEIDKTLFVYDDFHLPFGTVRFRKRGSDAGHNGLKSIIYYLQTEEFLRLKVGIGSEFTDSIDFVLSEFEKKEKKSLPEIFNWAVSGIEHWIQFGIDSAMNEFNRNILSAE